jgi:hypothetical protein
VGQVWRGWTNTDQRRLGGNRPFARRPGQVCGQVYGDFRTESEKRLVQRVFLELVQLGEGAEDTRRRISKRTILALGNPEQVLCGDAVLINGLLDSGGAGCPSGLERWLAASLR